MKNKEIIEKTITFVKEQSKHAESGHDWWHLYRVWKMAKNIADNYQEIDLLVIELACLLHDVADEKFDNFEEKNIELKNYISNLSISNQQKEHTLTIIQKLSFKKSFENTTEKSIEFQIVQDADRIDAIGAIGIARAFSYGGFKGREMYNPEIKPSEFKNSNDYQKSTSPTINHFYEKLFKLKEMMNTPEAKKLAEERHSFMHEYVNRFYDEWEGKK
jgi:uncharacterized protein